MVSNDANVVFFFVIKSFLLVFMIFLTFFLHYFMVSNWKIATFAEVKNKDKSKK